MADGHGGPRTPSKPAPASGPGRLSQRTDGGPAQKMREMTDQPYGDATAYAQQQQGAPMAATPPVPTVPGSQIAAAAQQAAPQGAGATPAFGRPTEQPQTPITDGAAIGPGQGPLPLPMSGLNARPDGYVTQTLKALSARDATGVLAALLDSASIRGV
jgi:hypothetical protein